MFCKLFKDIPIFIHLLQYNRSWHHSPISIFSAGQGNYLTIIFFAWFDQASVSSFGVGAHTLSPIFLHVDPNLPVRLLCHLWLRSAHALERREQACLASHFYDLHVYFPFSLLSSNEGVPFVFTPHSFQLGSTRGLGSLCNCFFRNLFTSSCIFFGRFLGSLGLYIPVPPLFSLRVMSTVRDRTGRLLGADFGTRTFSKLDVSWYVLLKGERFKATRNRKDRRWKDGGLCIFYPWAEDEKGKSTNHALGWDKVG